MRYGNINKIGIIVLSLAFALGQVVRIQLGTVGVTALDIVVGVISLVVLADYFWRSKSVLKFGDISKYILLFLLSGVVSLIFFSHNLSSSEFGVSILYPIRLVLYLGIYFWVKRFSADERKVALYCLTGAGVFILLAGCLQYFYYPYLRNLYYLGWDDHLYRLFSVFLDPNFAGAFFVLYLLFIIDIFKVAKTKIWQVTYFCIAALSVIAIFLTHSRTGLIMLIVGAAVYLLSYSTKKIAMICTIGFFILLIITSNTNIEGLNPFRMASTQARIDSMQNAVKIIARYPVFGVGFNSYRYAQIQMGFRQENILYPSHADAGTDNSYLFVLATTGIVGGVFFFLASFRSVRNLKELAQKNYFPARSLFAGLAAVLVGSFFLNIIFYPMILLWLILQAGLIRSRTL